MSITTYSELKSAVANWANRTDLTSRIPEFIALAETDMQVRCKNVEFESTGNITITDGAGSVPSGFVGMRSVYWDGDDDQELKYITPSQYAAWSYMEGVPRYYTLTGSSIKVLPASSGTVVATYNARFTPLSDSAPTNALLTNYHDAYLHGSLMQLSVYIKDTQGIETHSGLFEAAIGRVKTDNNQRKFAGPLEVRAR